MKKFCIAGPVNSEKHYFVPKRFDHDNRIKDLIEDEKYFILHAPRQTGKTTALLNYVKKLNSEGVYTALYINVEPAQACRGDLTSGIPVIVNEFRGWAYTFLPHDDSLFACLKHEEVTQSPPGGMLITLLGIWARTSQKPIVLFIDEIDSLIGDTLISVLRQLRSGYPRRPEGFPQTVCLVGLRDVRDYRIWSDEEQKIILGGSAFNIKAESLTLSDFTLEQVHNLYEQHTQETGQIFDNDAIEYAYELTRGQPWLVNALAYQACFRDVTDRTMPITKTVIERAKETIILRRDTHLDALIDRLREERVQIIVSAILLGKEELQGFDEDDLLYAQDLGIISRTDEGIVIANPIYKEIFPRALTSAMQKEIRLNRAFYIRPDLNLDMPKLFESFTQFYRENSAMWLEKFFYQEAGPHLLLMAFLQRIINGGGTIHREYALGLGRVDLLIHWRDQRIVIEMKIHHGPKTIEKGLEQTKQYMDTSNATEGHLVLFHEGDKKLPWEERIKQSIREVENTKISVWEM